MAASNSVNVCTTPTHQRPKIKYGHTMEDIKKDLRNMFLQRLREGRQNTTDRLRGINQRCNFLTLMELNRQLRAGTKFDNELLLEELCRVESEVLEDAAQKIAEDYEEDREKFEQMVSSDSDLCLACGKAVLRSVLVSVMCDDCVKAVCGQDIDF